MDVQQNLEIARKQRYRLGVNILVSLGGLTVAEFLVSMFGVTWLWVFVFIALVKAALVLRDYMHISRLFKGEEH